jgi:hypothetical protein
MKQSHANSGKDQQDGIGTGEKSRKTAAYIRRPSRLAQNLAQTEGQSRKLLVKLERAKGFEPSTLTLAT